MPEKYEQREQLLYQVSEKVMSEIWKKRLTVIKLDYEENHGRYDKEIIMKIERLLSQWENIYGNQTRTLQYLIISPLNSGVITESYEFQIAVFNRDLYLNENPMCFYWTPEFIYKDVKTDMLTFREMASKEIIRLREDEVNEMRRRYVLCHAYIAMFYMDEIMRKVSELPTWKKVALEDVKMLYGTYMEKMIEIGKGWEEGGK